MSYYGASFERSFNLDQPRGIFDATRNFALEVFFHIFED